MFVNGYKHDAFSTNRQKPWSWCIMNDILIETMLYLQENLICMELLITLIRIKFHRPLSIEMTKTLKKTEHLAEGYLNIELWFPNAWEGSDDEIVIPLEGTNCELYSFKGCLSTREGANALNSIVRYYKVSIISI
mgnify:CR=1 FL=1